MNEVREYSWGAVAESFFHTLKTELTHHEIYETRAQANQSIFVPQGHLSLRSGSILKFITIVKECIVQIIIYLQLSLKSLCYKMK